MSQQKRNTLAWDAEQYSHTLIATPSDWRPSAAQVQRFLATVISQEVVPGPPSITFRVPTGKYREYPFINPFTGQNLKVAINDQKPLTSVDEVGSAAGGLQEYEVEVAGLGKPRLAPLAINSDKPYNVEVRCITHATPRSTSDLHETAVDHKPNAIPYGEACGEIADRGYFTNPYTSEIIEVPGAGCASFWIEFELGKFLFPDFVDDSLELLNPRIVAEAKSAFQTRFVQGCRWG